MSDLLSLSNTRKEKQETSGFSDKIKTGYGLFFAEEVNVDYYGQPLCKIEGPDAKHLPLDLHKFIPITVEGQDKPMLVTKVCRKSAIIGEAECPYCKMKNYFDKSGKKLNRAQPHIVFPWYCFSWVGKEKEIEKRDGTKFNYTYNPVCFVAINRGVEDNNILEIIDDDMNDVFVDNVYTAKKKPKEAKEAMKLLMVDRRKAGKKFQHLPDGLEVPQIIKDQWNEMSKEAVRGLAANCFSLYTENPPKILMEYTVKPEAVPENEQQDADNNVSQEMDG